MEMKKTPHTYIKPEVHNGARRGQLSLRLSGTVSGRVGRKSTWGIVHHLVELTVIPKEDLGKNKDTILAWQYYTHKNTGPKQKVTI